MSFSKLCKTVAWVMLVLSLLGGIFFASEISKEVKVSYDIFGNIKNHEVQNDTTYATVLISTWVAGGILSLFIYGMGKIFVLLDNINYHLQEIDDKIEKKTSE